MSRGRGRNQGGGRPRVMPLLPDHRSQVVPQRLRNGFENERPAAVMRNLQIPKFWKTTLRTWSTDNAGLSA